MKRGADGERGLVLPRPLSHSDSNAKNCFVTELKAPKATSSGRLARNSSGAPLIYILEQGSLSSLNNLPTSRKVCFVFDPKAMSRQ